MKFQNRRYDFCLKYENNEKLLKKTTDKNKKIKANP